MLKFYVTADFPEDLSVFKEYVKNGGSINNKYCGGSTALHIAVERKK